MASASAHRSTPATWACLLLFFASVAACASPPPNSARDTAGAKQDDAMESAFDNLEIVGASLNARIVALRVGSEVGENNLLTVFAGFKNKTGRKLTLEVETIYKDKMGAALNHGSWIPLILKPHQENEYRSTAISEEAVDFLVRVRRAPTKG